MNNNKLILELQSEILKLEGLYAKTFNLKKKLDILSKLNLYKSQLNDLLELERDTIQSKYDTVISEKIKDINFQMNKTHQRGKYMQDYFYDLTKEVFIADSDYLKFIDKFWVDIVSTLNPNEKIIVRFLLQMSDTSGRTLNKTEVLQNNLDCLNNFKEIIKHNLNNIYSHYLEKDDDNKIIGFVMRYKILKNQKISETVSRKSVEIKKGKLERSVKIKSINYPLSTNSIEFGDIQYKEGNLTFVINSKKGLKFEFNRKEESQTIKVYKNGNLITTLVDIFIDLENNLFKRSVNNLSYYIKNGKVILKTKDYNPKFIEKAKFDKQFNETFLTGDIETLTKVDDKGKRFFEAYAVAWYNGSTSKTYYVTDYVNWEEMISKFLIDILSIKKENIDIYFHNLSGFDVNFLLKPLINIEGIKTEIVLREDKFINIKVILGDTTLNIKDSLLLIPGSLSKLSKAFKIETPKEVFPRKLFERETISADYISKIVPEYNKYFNQSEVSLDDYNKYCELFQGKAWSLKEETLKYVSIDCIALHQIITKFGNKIFDMWGVDIKTTPTLPSLCFKIYRIRYMPKEKIPIITGIPFKDIKQSYTGGSTEMYIPYGESVWCYDVNSLYPAAMTHFKYPVGKYFSFQNMGNLEIEEIESTLGKNLFGFLEVEVDCPKDVLHPILQIRREISSSNTRTFAPVGTFKAWFHTEEIREALKLNYKFKVISGYIFECEDIFSSYVEDLYRIKMEADQNKDQVWRLISKNLMNSLYGRFGMNQYLINNIVIDKDDHLMETVLEKNDIEDIIELDEKLLIQYLPKGYDTLVYQESLDVNISIAIASSVTAYSRIIMAKYKNKANYNLHYTDTDSLYLTFKTEADRMHFEKEFVDPLKLGYLKVENLKKGDIFVPYERFYFLGPKFYVAINNGEIDFSNKTKIRGLQKSYRSDITEEMIKSMLDYNRKPIKIETMKWYKDITESKIFIESRPYNLNLSVNKNSLVYRYESSDNIKLINTFPLIMKDNLINYKGEYILKNGKIYTE